MPTRTRLIATATAIIVITGAVGIAKINGSASLAVVTAVVGVAGFCIFMGVWNQRFRRRP